MEVGIDARIACYSAAGIARFARGMLCGLSALLATEEAAREPMRPRSDSRSNRLDCVVYRARKQRYPLTVDSPLQLRTLYTPPHFALPGMSLEWLTLPWELRSQRLQLFHALDFYAPTPRSLPTILTVYDLYFLSHPEVMDGQSARHYRRLLEALPHAAHVICTSEDTRRALDALALVDPRRVSVIYPGVDPEVIASPAGLVEQVAARRDLRKGCLLFVGTIEPRKNIPRMVEAYLRAVHDHGMSMLPPFVLVGRDGYRGAEIREECLRLARLAGLSDRVRFVGPVSEEELRGFYSLAKALLFVTCAEGFGFPIVEAMVAGVPVITATGSASAEVAADAALLTDPDDTAGIAEAIAMLLGDPSQIAALRMKGLKRAECFRWEDTSARVLGLYRDLLGISRNVVGETSLREPRNLLQANVSQPNFPHRSAVP